MAVRIPQYQQQTSPSTLGTVPRARGVAVDASVGQGLQRLGAAGQHAIDTYAQVQERIKAEAKAAEIEDAKVYTANSIAQGAQAAMQEFTRRQEEAAAGAPDFAQGMNDWLDEYEETVVSQAPNDTAKKFLRERYLALRVDMTQRAMAYEADERRRWRVQTGKDAIDATAATMAADPSRLPVVLAEQRAMIDAYAIPPEQKAALRQYLDEQVSTAAVLGEAERDPAAARAKLAQRLGVDEAQLAGPVASADVVWQRMIERESGGDQSAISPKGAVGIAQVMPDTGPEAARLAGLPWDPARFRSDAHYNAALGRAYFDQQLRDFGNPMLAAAAYNAGPGAVKEWLGKIGDPRKGEVSYADFARRIPYKETRDYVAAVAPASMTVAQAAAANPKGERTGAMAYDLLPVPKVVSLLGQVNSELDKQRTQFRSYVAAREADDLAAYGDGKQPPAPLTVGEFVGAYGEVEGMRRWQAYQGAQSFATEMAGLATKTPAEIAAIVKAREPQPGEGYAAAAQQYGALVQAANAVLTRRAEDPVAYAMGAGLTDAQPLELADADALGAGLKERVGLADTLNRKYGTRYSLLTKAEAEQMAGMLGGMTAPEKAQFLGTVRANLPDPRAYQSIMAQLRPDSPVTATAGSLMAVGGQVRAGDVAITADQVAQRVLVGEDLLNPSKGDKAGDGKPKFPMPTEADLRTVWADYTSTAYAGAPDTEAASYQAFRAFYAADRAAAGDYSGEFDEDAAERAAAAVTGGVVEIGDSAIVLPWGLPERYVRDQLRQDWQRQAKAAGLAAVPFEAIGLTTVGDGVYAVTAGTGPVKGKDGQPMLLRVTRRNQGLVPDVPTGDEAAFLMGGAP
jgi:soluble lytic murein transglycosylase